MFYFLVLIKYNKLDNALNLLLVGAKVKKSDKKRIEKIDLFLDTIKSLAGDKKRPIDEKTFVQELVKTGKFVSMYLRATSLLTKILLCILIESTLSASMP